MVGELLGATARVMLLHIPYRGGGAPAPAVVAGDVDTLTVAAPHIKSGQLRALAITSAESWPSVPGVPTIAAALPGFELRSWLGLAAPAGTSAEVGQKPAAESHQALKAPDLQQTLANAGSAATARSPEQMRAAIVSEIAQRRDVIEQVGIPLKS